MNCDDLSKQDDVRFQIMRLLESNPHYTQRDISKHLGISLGRANYCMKALVGKGLMKISNFRTAENKMRYAYVLTPQGISERAALTARFLKRKMREYEALKAEIEALRCEAGISGSPD